MYIFKGVSKQFIEMKAESKLDNKELEVFCQAQAKVPMQVEY